ncbi:hypothetical protein EOL70_24915 [Leucothrix sargassi]|nr:hypothetical protein EOL70_24915 [Leucothrix sargassi]
MTRFDPSIFLNRLVIQKDNHEVYNQCFHKGVNIIRGTNSAGKSTIMEFIFFALGGSISPKQWKNTSLKCTEVFAEVEINGKIFTLQRNVSDNPKEGMRIYQGHYETFSIKESINFPYASTAEKESYHDNLLKLLQIPKTQSSDEGIINFHQILRLIYTDQLTNVSRIFREEDFDSNLKRETIGDLLLGVTGNTILSKKLEFIRLDKELTKKISEVNSFLRLYQDYQKKEDIDNLIVSNQEKIEELRASFESTLDEVVNEETRTTIELMQVKLNDLIELKKNKISELNKYNFEVIDSEAFIKSLSNRLIDIEESARTLNVLSDIEFLHCPSCFTQLKEKANANQCKVCGTVHETEYESPTYRIRKNIEFQIRETQSLIPNFKIKTDELADTVARLSTQIDNLRSEIMILQRPHGGISIEKKLLLLEMGGLERENVHLTEKIIQLEKFYTLQAEKEELQRIVTDLKAEIENAYYKIQKAKERKELLIANKTLELIKKDLDREESFKNAQQVTFSFLLDTIKVDDVSLFSASSTALLKTCFKLAILIASCNESSFLYPRLALLDNVEDKGMEEIRSQNLQKLIVEESERVEIEHQIIFTTSMIDPTLNNDKYCIGEFYTSSNKTLKIM